jgi:hypothetical protein
MKKIVLVAVGVLIGLLVLSAAKDLVIKVSVENAVSIVTGLKLSIKGLNVGIIRPVVDVKGLRIYNPPSFQERIMLDMPQIYVDYDLPAILRKDIHLRKVVIDLKEFMVVKNSKGELNLNSLKVVQDQKKGRVPAAKGRALRAPKIRIDDLHLKIGKAVYKDYSTGPDPLVREFNINMDERYTGINDLYSLVSLIVVKSLANTNISSVANFDIGGLQNTLSGTVTKVNAAAGQAVQKTQEAVKGASEVTKEVGNMFKTFGGK